MEKIAIKRSIWIAAPRERVWQAVTDPEQIAQWFAPGTTLSQNGNTISVRMGETDVEVAVIELFDPPRQFTTRSLPDRAITTTYTLEELLRQRLRDLEGKKVLALIAGTSGHPQTFGGAMASPIGQPEAVKEAAKLAALSQPVDVSRLKRLGEYR